MDQFVDFSQRSLYRKQFHHTSQGIHFDLEPSVRGHHHIQSHLLEVRPHAKSIDQTIQEKTDTNAFLPARSPAQVLLPPLLTQPTLTPPTHRIPQQNPHPPLQRQLPPRLLRPRPNDLLPRSIPRLHVLSPPKSSPTTPLTPHTATKAPSPPNPTPPPSTPHPSPTCSSSSATRSCCPRPGNSASRAPTSGTISASSWMSPSPPSPSMLPARRCITGAR